MLRGYLKFGCKSEMQSSCTRKPFKFHSALYAVAFSALGRSFMRAVYSGEHSRKGRGDTLLSWFLELQVERTESEREILNSVRT